MAQGCLPKEHESPVMSWSPSGGSKMKNDPAMGSTWGVPPRVWSPVPASWAPVPMDRTRSVQPACLLALASALNGIPKVPNLTIRLRVHCQRLSPTTGILQLPLWVS